MGFSRTIVLATCVVGALSLPAVAEDAVTTDGAKAQLALSDQLIAIGQDRKDPLLIIAGAHLRDNLTNDPIPDAGEIPDKAALMDEAKGYAADREDLAALADDVKDASSRGCYNWNGGTGSFSCPIGSQFAR